MNQQQYRIVKMITDLPLLDTSKFAGMLKVDHSEVLRVKMSNNFEQYRQNDRPAEDINSFFDGALGSNPFGHR